MNRFTMRKVAKITRFFLWPIKWPLLAFVFFLFSCTVTISRTKTITNTSGSGDTIKETSETDQTAKTDASLEVPLKPL